MIDFEQNEVETEERVALHALHELLTVHEVARWLRVSDQVIYKLIRSAEIEAIKVGGSYRVNRGWLAGKYGTAGAIHVEHEYVVDDEIRDNEPRVRVQDVPWKTPLNGPKDAGMICYRVTDGPDWWSLDDLSVAVLGWGKRLGGHKSWNFIDKSKAPRLVAAFDAVGKLDRLEFAEAYVPGQEEKKLRG